jgi:hypothetical protein
MKLFIRHCGGSKWEEIGEVLEISFETERTKVDISTEDEEIKMAVETKNKVTDNTYSKIAIRPNEIAVG